MIECGKLVGVHGTAQTLAPCLLTTQAGANSSAQGLPRIFCTARTRHGRSNSLSQRLICRTERPVPRDLSAYQNPSRQ
jgi:hypothetical protein